MNKCIKFCNIIPPNFEYMKELLNTHSFKKQVSNFGPLYFLLKEKLIEYFNLDSSKSVVITSSGHTALMAALASVNAKHVLVPSYTFASTLQAATLQGINYTIVDVELDTGIPSLETIASHKDAFDTLLLVCPLSCVNPNLADYEEWCEKNNKKLVIDGAATFGTPGEHLRYGDAYCMSFHATKSLPVGEGGCVICPKGKEKDIMQYINFGTGKDKRILSSGLNAKVSEYTCAIALALLARIGIHMVLRKINSDMFQYNLKYPTLLSIEENIYASYPIYLPSKEEALEKIQILKQNNIEVIQYYVPLEKTKNAVSLYERSVCLPCHSYVSANDCLQIIRIINE